MAVLPLVTAPDPRLAVPSAAVDTVDDTLRTFINDMIDTMYASDGIGLAAVQVGVHKRILVMDLQENDTRHPHVVINPVIINSSDNHSIYKEGCLSFPGQTANVTRPDRVTVEYLDIQGDKQTMECDGLLATCIQHEIDHLNGVTFVDHLSRLKKDMILRKMRKLR